MWFWIFVRRFLIAVGPFEEPEDEPAFWAGVTRDQWGWFVDSGGRKLDHHDAISDVRERADAYEGVRRDRPAGRPSPPSLDHDGPGAARRPG